MAELSIIKVPANTPYELKDLYAVSDITYSDHTVTITKRGGGTSAFVTADTTYTLTQDSNDGHTIVFTPSSGSATTITIPDNFTSADKAKLDSLDTNKYFRIGLYDYVNGDGDILNDQNSNTLIGGSLTGIAFGDYDNNFVEGEHSVAFGYHTNADLDYSVAFGKYNSGGYVFSVGCGTSNDDRENAIAVDNNGNVFVNNITVSGGATYGGNTTIQNLSGTTATFSGNISAVDGVFSGDVSADGGTYTGDISAVNGTFSGNVSVATAPSQNSHLVNKAYVDGKILYPVPEVSDNGKLLVAYNGTYVLKTIEEILGLTTGEYVLTTVEQSNGGE